MTPLRRWCVVAALVVLVAAAPFAPRLLPVSSSDASASALLAQVRGASAHGYSGYVETSGTLALPVGDRFSDVGSLFGEQNRLRVWWRDAADWRVDRLEAAGETDLVHAGAATTSFDYSGAEAVTSVDPDIRLPRSADLLPPTLARTVLDGAVDDEVTRLDARRVAGVDAAGLRLTPSTPLTSIDHVDLWVDPVTGVPLRVEVYAAASGTAAFTTTFVSWSSTTPAADLVAFRLPEGVEARDEDALDIADAANQYAPLRPPDTVAGLTRSSTEAGAVGVYGTGVARFIAIPLRQQEADPLRTQLRATPGATTVDAQTFAGVGPLGVLLTGSPGEGGWLVTGTVTPDTLARAGHDLVAGTVYLEDGR